MCMHWERRRAGWWKMQLEMFEQTQLIEIDTCSNPQQNNGSAVSECWTQYNAAICQCDTSISRPSERVEVKWKTIRWPYRKSMPRYWYVVRTKSGHFKYVNSIQETSTIHTLVITLETDIGRNRIKSPVATEKPNWNHIQKQIDKNVHFIQILLHQICLCTSNLFSVLLPISLIWDGTQKACTQHTLCRSSTRRFSRMKWRCSGNDQKVV